MMAKIFISYRRQDTGQIVASMYNSLAEAFGPENVFIDTRGIPSGEYFTPVIEQNVREAKVMLVIIGKHWLGTQDDGHRRIDEQDDLVRAEVRLGLELARQGQLTLIPVLVDDTSMPQSQQLPSDLSDVRWRNAAQLHSSLTYFTDDINRLLEDIDKVGIPRRVSGRIEHPRDYFALLSGPQIVENGPTPSSRSTSPTSHAAPTGASHAAAGPRASQATSSTSHAAPTNASRVVAGTRVPPPASVGKSFLQLLLLLFLESPRIVKGFIVLAVIVGVVAAVQNLTTPKLTEHSTCQQFEQADYNAQTQALQQMMTAHGSPGNQLSTTRLSVGLYCNVMGPNAPIDGIYNG